MYFPKLTYSTKKKMRQIGGFLGLNRTENFKEGQLRDSVGLTSEQYPTLTQSKPFVPYSEQSGIVDMYEHNGKLLTVADDGLLVFEGKNIGYVTSGRKQFATVNTRLCIFPDKKYIDLNTLELHDLADTITAPDVEGAVEVSGNSVTFNGDAPYLTGSTERFGDRYKDDYDMLCTYAYGTSRADVAARWDATLGVWRNLRDLESKVSLVEWEGADIDGLYKGYIFIPDDDGKIVYGDHNSGTFNIDTTKYNTSGKYCVVTNVDKVEEYDGEDIYYVTNTYTYDVYRASDNVKVFSDMFSEGSVVDVSGSPASLYDGVGITVEGLSQNGDTLTFADNTFSGAVSYYELTENIRGDKIIKARYYVYTKDDNGEETKDEYISLVKVTIPDTIKAGKVIYFRNPNGETYMYVWDKQKMKTVAQYEAEVIPSGSADLEMVAFDIGNDISVSKHIPDLDYICESENRLWGVSNRTHTIYASALGLPGEFTEFDVVSTDSYAVAVASEDDFTAICAYGGGVCCFKENRLHKMLGSFPAEYYINEYEIAGVQKGSERSLQIIDEVLYYKGKYGVYAYSGGVPKLISYELGNVESTARSSAALGMDYYISLGDGVYVYDKLHGLWMKQSADGFDTMLTDNEHIIALRDGEIYSNSGNERDAQWSLELVPFESGTAGKRCYSRLMLRVDMSENAFLQISVREDGKRTKNVYSHRSIKATSFEVPLPIGSCDRFCVTINGKGKVVLRSMAVEYLG